MSRLVAVAVPVPFLDALTYRVPASLPVPCVGARVLVPVGRRIVTGCVVADQAPPHEGPVREIGEVLDDEPFLPESVLELVRWVADYYACGLGEAIGVALPPRTQVASQRWVELTAAGRQALDTGALTPAQRLALGAVGAGPPRRLMSAVAEARKALAQVEARPADGRGGPSPRAVEARIHGLARAGLVELTRPQLARPDGFKSVTMASLTDEGRAVVEQPGTPRLGARQRQALEALAGAPEGLPAPQLRRGGVAVETLRRLAARGLVQLRRTSLERNPLGAQPSGEAPVERVLTAEQDRTLARLQAVAGAGVFHVALVHGVTASGKTEVYVRLALSVQARGRRALVLVPEIALTPAIARAFRVAFGTRVAIQHSGLSDGERHDQWHRIRAGEVDVVVGTRSAVFAPLPALGLVIVDEEHDGSYKQEESPRYHGRDVAIMRAKRESALVVLGSATPSMESFHHARTGRYELLPLAQRVEARPLATVRIVDMRAEYATRGAETILSDALVEGLQARQAAGEQSLVLLNRRGYAVAMVCRECAGTLECPNCCVSLTVHRRAARARCHYCNFSRGLPRHCPACGGEFLELVGIGTERVEAEVRALLPGLRVARLDRDTVRRRGAVAALLERFERHELDTLVGTQMIAKGHDFPAVTLVGVVSADVGLGLADFRAAERTFQLLTQVAGRAGRGHRPGEAIIQTLYPQHYSVRCACTQDYAGFFDEEIRFRRAMRYPPLTGLVNTVVRGPSLAEAMRDAGHLAAEIRSRANGFRVLGPAPAALERLRGEHRVQLLSKGPSRRAVRAALREALAARPELRRRITIDVDPLSVL